MRESQTHKQVMSREQIQYLKVLAMTNYELYEFLLSEAMDNPLLDVENMGQQFQMAQSRWQYEQSRSGHELENVRSGEQQIAEIPDWRGNPLEESVEESLISQLPQLSKRKERLMRSLIGYLDDFGYLLLDEKEFMQQNACSSGELKEIIGLLQSLEPSGIGARDLKECLLLQLSGKKCADTLAVEIVSGYLQELGAP